MKGMVVFMYHLLVIYWFVKHTRRGWNGDQALRYGTSVISAVIDLKLEVLAFSSLVGRMVRLQDAEFGKIGITNQIDNNAKTDDCDWQRADKSKLGSHSTMIAD